MQQGCVGTKYRKEKERECLVRLRDKGNGEEERRLSEIYKVEKKGMKEIEGDIGKRIKR